jgi:hypothetical protein
MSVTESGEQATELGRFWTLERHNHEQSFQRETKNTSHRVTPEVQ